ncbi:hypothetical protein L2E82_49917 [Cichorium intybus]|uniref:Uncharacterized protein n=1 Tax=Cichorium intybus TaxID=13427 RepID=A0ACB8Z0P2_CICIN|nr:hypothetical protein L2E82_49917 [Cichorium intybus]
MMMKFDDSKEVGASALAAMLLSKMADDSREVVHGSSTAGSRCNTSWDEPSNVDNIPLWRSLFDELRRFQNDD